MARTCKGITRKRLHKLQSQDIRVTIKAIFYNPKTEEVLLIHNADDGKVSFPGGGLEREDKYSASRALRREILEELHGAKPSMQKVRNAPVLSSGRTPTERRHFKARHVFIILLRRRSIDKIWPADHEHVDFRVLPLDRAIEYVANHELTPVESRGLYIRALLKLEKQKRT